MTVITDLAQALGLDLPLRGLQPRRLCGSMTPHLDVPSAARAYVEAIRLWQAPPPGNHLTLLSPLHIDAVVTWTKEVLFSTEMHA